MQSLRLRVEYRYDPESHHWGFRVPVLHVIGGGCLTREEAQTHALDAVRFALDDDSDTDAEPGVEATYLELAPV